MDQFRCHHCAANPSQEQPTQPLFSFPTAHGAAHTHLLLPPPCTSSLSPSQGHLGHQLQAALSPSVPLGYNGATEGWSWLLWATAKVLQD